MRLRSNRGEGMRAPEYLLKTWSKFDSFPMETLTKAWYRNKGNLKKQRPLSMMKEHREQYGISGNCFDLAIWLLDEFRQEGIMAYPIGDFLDKEHVHVAVVAVDDRGRKFLCDLGDQWICPILIDAKDTEFSGEALSGFFPGADVQVREHGDRVEVLYHRPNGKVSKQVYRLDPIPENDFFQTAEYVQNIIGPAPVLETRVRHLDEIGHWEFYNWKSWLSTSKELIVDGENKSLEAWSETIHMKTGYDKGFLNEALKIYHQR